MTHYPDFATFRALSERFDLIPVYRRLYSDTMTPVTAFHRLDDGRSACLFESVVGGEKVGRYSFLAAGPYLELLASGQRVTGDSRRHDVGVYSRGSARTCSAAGCAKCVRRICRNCRLSPAVPWAMPDTTSCGMSNICPTRPRTTASCPTWRSGSTTGWWSSTM